MAAESPLNGMTGGVGSITLTESAPSRPPPKKRRRAVISCVECHRRKQKCDRELPCANCKFRNKESVCRYESSVPSLRTSTRSISPVTSASTSDVGSSRPPAVARRLSKTAEPRDDSDAKTLPSTSSMDAASCKELRERYKSLIRHLPAKSYVDQLVSIYFREVNWHYHVLDEDEFLRMVDCWSQIPFEVFQKTGPMDLSPDMRVFPALLFQVLATVLLVVDDEPKGPFESLKYVGTMSLRDLAIDYSESGHALLSLVGRTQVTVTTVQAGMIHSMLFAYMADILGSWTILGETIAHARTIGMHDDLLDPKPSTSRLQDILQTEWLIQKRRSLYMMLQMWDAHFSLILGKPPFVNLRDRRPSLPVDAIPPKDKSTCAVIARTEGVDPPTPLTRSLWLFRLAAPLRDAEFSENARTNSMDFSRAELLGKQMLETAQQIPPYFRLESTDWSWDNHPACPWLTSSRFCLEQFIQFNLMVLHRSYILSQSTSRTEALRAAIKLLACQQMLYQGAGMDSWKNFLLFFSSFDALILISMVYTLFPRENGRLYEEAKPQFDWTMKRYKAMQNVNPLATPAMSAVESCFKRMKNTVMSSMRAADPLSIASICTSPTIPSPPSMSEESSASSPPPSEKGICFFTRWFGNRNSAGYAGTGSIPKAGVPEQTIDISTSCPVGHLVFNPVGLCIVADESQQSSMKDDKLVRTEG
ncbi:hypothetical protein jhhlp_001501 [Lomentospora prolificans]|uniref:Zn(2)-C6 fungal-type domain-containing protein n=1 Tax=Lomentospora prolificans TaxID=41688 RepID=A0A2N3NIM1_9PEZI|nr:hypothetical protein jhhlp_001501 [Lomentospora prolificans]